MDRIPTHWKARTCSLLAGGESPNPPRMTSPGYCEALGDGRNMHLIIEQENKQE